MAAIVRRASGSSTFSGCSRASGWTLMYSLMMNSIRASPTPSLGRNDVLNARSGLPRLSMIFVRGRAMSPTSMRSTWKPTAPSYTRPESPSAQDTVTTWPSGTQVVASPVPTTAGMPSSRAMIDAWQVRPPRLVTIAAAVFITGSQSGVVVSATSTSPGLEFGELREVLDALAPRRRRSARRPSGPR